jgi:hypothetical protein
LCQSAVFTDAVIELGGEHTHTLEGYLAALRDCARAPARVLYVAPWLSRCVAALCDVLHLTPFSTGHYELLRVDNVPATALARVWRVPSVDPWAHTPVGARLV